MRLITRMLTILFFIWVGYTAALLIGGSVCLALKVTLSFTAVWFGMLIIIGVLVATLMLKCVVLGVLDGLKKRRDRNK